METRTATMKEVDAVTDEIIPAFEHIEDRDYRRIIAGCWARAAINCLRRLETEQ